MRETEKKSIKVQSSEGDNQSIKTHVKWWQVAIKADFVLLNKFSKGRLHWNYNILFKTEKCKKVRYEEAEKVQGPEAELFHNRLWNKKEANTIRWAAQVSSWSLRWFIKITFCSFSFFPTRYITEWSWGPSKAWKVVKTYKNLFRVSGLLDHNLENYLKTSTLAWNKRQNRCLINSFLEESCRIWLSLMLTNYNYKAAWFVIIHSNYKII